MCHSEIKPHTDPFVITKSLSFGSSNRFRASGNESNCSKMFPSCITKSISRISSSHFYDLDPENYDAVEDADDAILERMKEDLTRRKTQGNQSILYVNRIYRLIENCFFNIRKFFLMGGGRSYWQELIELLNLSFRLIINQKLLMLLSLELALSYF